MADNDLLVADDGSVRTITLNRPAAKNTLTGPMLAELVSALDGAGQDPAVRVVVLTNAGNTFCAGADLTDARPGVSGLDTSGAGGPGVSLADVFGAIQNCPIPVVGMIDGHAVGGGVGLMAACDISYVRSDAKIGFTEVRLGVAPAVISVVCLPKMRRADAMEFFLSGERFPPERAAAMGLINAAVDAAELRARVDELVGRILLGGPSAVVAAKRIVNTMPSMDSDTAYREMTALSQSLFDAPEAQAGIAAYRRREPAPWVEGS